MALTAPVRYGQRTGESTTGQNAYIVKNAIRIYAGALVGIDPSAASGGKLQKFNDSSGGVRFLGVAMPTTDSVLGDSAASPQPECPVNESGVILEGVSVTGVTGIKDQGKPVYATDENTFTLTATSNVGAVGRFNRFNSGTVGDVQLFTPMQYAALQAMGKV